MNQPLSICLFFVLFSIAPTFAQVHVRGYYRSNGTYVQPHERTRPNKTVTDNYSYPGNYNPNSGKITGGDRIPDQSKQSVSLHGETIYTYSSTTARAVRYSFPEPIERELTVNGLLRENYVESAQTIKAIPKGAKVTLIGKDYDSYRAIFEGTMGYLYYSYIDKDYPAFLAVNPLLNSRDVQKSTEANEIEPPIIHYQYFTKLRLDSPLRSQPISSASMIYELPAGSIIQLGSYNDSYWYAQGNGYEGYLGVTYVEKTSRDSSSLNQSDRAAKNYRFSTSSDYTTKSSFGKTVKTTSQNYIRGPRGGCYYLTSSGRKQYVDRSLCD